MPPKNKSCSIFYVFLDKKKIENVLKTFFQIFFFQVEKKNLKNVTVLTVEELFAYIFGIYIKFDYNNPSILAPSDSVNVAT